MSTPGKERLAAIDALRGLAALSVVLYHFLGFIPLMSIPVGAAGDILVAVTRYGHLGVEVFFVLSGFVIAMTAARYSFSPSVGARFVLRRLVRIVPPYWFVVGLTAGTFIAGKAAGFFLNTTVTPDQLAAHLVYAQNVLGYVPLDDAYWTLCLEVQFYFVFAVSMVALSRFSANVWVCWFTALTLGSLAVDVADAVPRDWFPRLWHQFGVGVLVYHSRTFWFARWPLVLVLLTSASLGVYRKSDSDFVVLAVACVLLLMGRHHWLWAECPAILVKLGGISYSLYLIHGYVGKGLDILLRRGVGRSEPFVWFLMAGAVVAALALAAALYYWSERRAIEWSRRVRVA